MARCCGDAGENEEGPACNSRSLCTAMHVCTVLEAACRAMHVIHSAQQTQCLQGFSSNSQEGEPSCDPQNPMLGKAFKVEE